MKKKIIKSIKKIQDKPEDEKTKIVWILSVFFMILIIGGWFSSFKNNKSVTNNDFNKIVIPPFPDIETELNELDATINNLDNLKTGIVDKNEQVQIEKIAKLYIEENLSKEVYDSLKIKQIEKQKDNWHLEYQQYHKDILIEENKILLTMNNTNGKVTDFVSNYDKDINIDITPNVEIKEAQDKIISKLNDESLEFKNSNLIIYKNIVKKHPKEYRLAWKINVISKPFQNSYYYIDAKDGEILYYYSLDK
ncbi:MAG: hypothetical protein KAS01_00555 [Candidatus Pacebacteria bacterium]|nr:hypothetical protein [Candidatus Paceibacterota bacterium]